MEQQPKPDRYTPEEWEDLKDVAQESDDPIPEEEYSSYLRGVLINIAAHAEANSVKPPQIVIDIIDMGEANYKYMAWWIGASKLDIQLWAGDQKIAITRRAMER